jgi:hypothetical protein
MYPTGPYGTQSGDTLDPNLTWQGYSEGSNQPTTISIADYLDCDGSKGINAVLIDSSAIWCPACQDEATALPSDMQKWAPLGIRVLTLMIEDGQHMPATVANADQWKKNFGLDTSAVVADPKYSMLPPGDVGLPYQTILDPRTMKVTTTQEGYSKNIPALIALAMKNAPP